MKCMRCGIKFDGRIWNNKSEVIVPSGYAGERLRIPIAKELCFSCNEAEAKERLASDMRLKALTEEVDVEAQERGYDDYYEMESELERSLR